MLFSLIFREVVLLIKDVVRLSKRNFEIYWKGLLILRWGMLFGEIVSFILGYVFYFEFLN